METNTYVEQPKTNTNAIISLVMGILSFIIPFIGFILAIVGIVLSVKAKKVIRETNEGGKGLATTGMILSVVSIVLQILGVIAMIVFFTAVANDISTYSTY